MQFTVLINQARSLEWGLTAPQAMLYSFVYGAAGWAESIERDGSVWFFLNRQKVCDEMPLLTDKPDTVYRLLKQLEEKGLVRLRNEANKPFVSITRKGALWNNTTDPSPPENPPESAPKPVDNLPPRVGDLSDPEPQGSDNFPSRVGNLSEQGSDNFPTDHITNNQITKINKKNINNFYPQDSGTLAEFDVSRLNFDQLPVRAEFQFAPLDDPLEQILAEFRVYHGDAGTIATRDRWLQLLRGWVRKRIVPRSRGSGPCRPSGQQGSNAQ